MLPNVILAESLPQRARFAWLGAALAATVAVFALTLGGAEPAAAPHKSRIDWRSPTCGEARAARIERARREAERRMKQPPRAERATRVYLSQ